MNLNVLRFLSVVFMSQLYAQQPSGSHHGCDNEPLYSVSCIVLNSRLYPFLIPDPKRFTFNIADCYGLRLLHKHKASENRIYNGRIISL